MTKRKGGSLAENRLRGVIATQSGAMAAQAVYDARLGVFKNRLPQLARLLGFQPNGRRVVCSPPRTLAALAPGALQPASSLQADVDWAISQILSFPIGELKSAILDIENGLLNDRPKHALESLSRIEARFGLSVWSLEARLAITQLTEGLEAQKRLRSEWIVGGLTHAPLFAIYQASERNEEIVSYANFIARAEASLVSLGADDAWKHFLRFRAFKNLPRDSDVMIDVLRVSAATSPIDLYDALTYVIPHVLHEKIDRTRAVDTFVSAAKIEAAPSEHLGDLAWSARRSLDSNGEWRSLIGDDLQKLISRASIGESIDRNLAKVSVNFDFIPFGRDIRAFVDEVRERSIDQIVARCARWSAAAAGPPGQSRVSAIYSTSDSNSSISYQDLFEWIASDADQLTRVVSLLNEGDAHDKSVAVKILCSRLVLDGDWLGGISIAVEASLQSPGLAAELPIDEYFGARNWRELKASAAREALLLGLHFASRYSPESIRRDEYGRYLQYCAFELATLRSNGSYSDLGKDESIPVRTRIFILDNIFVPKIMEYAPKMQSSRQVSEARIAVCQQLSMLDPKSSSRYADEIKELTYRIEIQEATESFDQSRLHVDTNQIRERCRIVIEEDFERYKSLNDLLLDDVTAIKQAIQALRQDPKDSGLAKRLLQPPKTDADEFLVDILKRVRNEYLFNPDLGLDAVLSLRMRHGSFAGYLRGELERSKLITSFDAGTDSYKENLHWIAEIEPSAIDCLTMQTAFASFSSEFDGLIRRFVDEFLQIRTEKKIHGSIEVLVWSVDFNLIKAAVDNSMSVDDFVNRTLNVFETDVKKGLVTLKERLDRDLREPVETLLTKLRRDLSALARYPRSTELFDAIAQAGTHVSNNIEKVKGWLVYAARREQPKMYSLEQILEIALQVTRNAYPTFQTKVSHNLSDMDVAIGEGAFGVADALFIALENAHKYASSSNPTMSIVAEVLPDSSGISFTTKNPIDHLPSFAELNKVEDVRSTIAQGVDVSRVRQEGGTGLLKLSRMAKRDQADRPIQFGFAGREFFLSFSIPMRRGYMHAG